MITPARGVHLRLEALLVVLRAMVELLLRPEVYEDSPPDPGATPDNDPSWGTPDPSPPPDNDPSWGTPGPEPVPDEGSSWGDPGGEVDPGGGDTNSWGE